MLRLTLFLILILFYFFLYLLPIAADFGLDPQFRIQSTYIYTSKPSIRHCQIRAWTSIAEMSMFLHNARKFFLDVFIGGNP